MGQKIVELEQRRLRLRCIDMRRVVSDWTGVRHHPRPYAAVGLRPDPTPNIGGRSLSAQRDAGQVPARSGCAVPVNNRAEAGASGWRLFPTATDGLWTGSGAAGAFVPAVQARGAPPALADAQQK